MSTATIYDLLREDDQARLIERIDVECGDLVGVLEDQRLEPFDAVLENGNLRCGWLVFEEFRQHPEAGMFSTLGAGMN